jgi:hypothetical protein
VRHAMPNLLASLISAHNLHIALGRWFGRLKSRTIPEPLHLTSG